MIRSFKTGLRLNRKQEQWLSQTLGYQRWSFNQHLDAFKIALDHSEQLGLSYVTPATVAKFVRDSRPEWALALSQNPFDNGRRNFEQALKNFHNCRRGKHRHHRPGECGFPAHHRRKSDEAVELSDGHPERIKVHGRKLWVPKLGEVNLAEDAPHGVAFKNIHARRTAGRWYAVLTCNDGLPEPETPETGCVVGVDLGQSVLAVTSDGRRFENEKPLKAAESKLKKLDRKIARSKKAHSANRPSNRRNKLQRRRAKAHAKVRNVRRTSHRQAAATITKSADVVVVEDLNNRLDQQLPTLTKGRADAGLGDLLRETAWQCRKRGKLLITADRWFASTQLCSACRGYPGIRLTLADRWYHCEHCGFECDRDLNAAINLEKYGVSQLAHAFGASIKARGEGTYAFATAEVSPLNESCREQHVFGQLSFSLQAVRL